MRADASQTEDGVGTNASQAAMLAAYVVLAALTSLYWFRLVAPFEAAHWAATVLVASGAASGLIRIGASAMSSRTQRLAASAVLVVALAAGLVGAGVPMRFVLPAGWADLTRELDMGLAGVSQLELPYTGNAAWTRLGILGAVPLALTLAAGLVFWPRRRGYGYRIPGLIVLISLMGVSVTWEAPPGELAVGIALFVGMGAFIWGPRLDPPRTLAAALTIVVAALTAAGLASRVDASEPLVSYTTWKFFGEEPIVAFEWDHTYGPIDWPQVGTELFRVESKEALYWKTVVLDDFDGAAWTRGSSGFGAQGTDGYAIAGAAPRFFRDNEQWVRDFDVAIGRLQTSLAISAGSSPTFTSLEVDSTAGDGTTSLGIDELPDGTEYGVSAYAPTPSARALRRASQTYPQGLERYTLLLIDGEDEQAPPLVVSSEPFGARTTRAERLQATFRPDIGSALEGTAYERVLGLARRLTRDARSDYEAVAAIENYLLANYEYNQEVPNRRHPLPAFLFRDNAGYCQQFSGAMALMLRMVGIPSRVVAGFAPGQRLAGENEFVVRDTDAHSWVEVYFPGVGWVTVDPTPAATPARTQVFASTTASELGGDVGGVPAFSIDGVEGRSGNEAVARGRPEESGDGRSPVPALAVLAGLGALGALRFRRRRLLVSPEGAEPQLRELERALRARLAVTPGTTLLGLERAARERFGRSAGEYAKGLRGNRYEPDLPRRPGPVERRAFRRDLARADGPIGWLRALRSVPPGGPRRVRR